MKRVCERVVSEKPKDLLLEYIDKNFDDIMPLRITQGFKFQIRFNPSEFETLDDEIKGVLVKCVIPDEIERFREENEDKYSDATMRDFYWDRCDSYVFNYKSESSYMLEIKCRYKGYLDLGEMETIYFIDQNEFSKCIIDNVRKYEDDEFVY